MANYRNARCRTQYFKKHKRTNEQTDNDKGFNLRACLFLSVGVRVVVCLICQSFLSATVERCTRGEEMRMEDWVKEI